MDETCLSKLSSTSGCAKRKVNSTEGERDFKYSALLVRVQNFEVKSLAFVFKIQMLGLTRVIT